jgi:hypothetical protein
VPEDGGAWLFNVRGRSEEVIDGVVLRAIVGTASHVEVAVFQLHLRVGRHHVDAVRFDADTLDRLDDGQRCVRRQE